MQGVFYGSDGTRTRDLRRDRVASRLVVYEPVEVVFRGRGSG
jgi:hypothetical protein